MVVNAMVRPRDNRQETVSAVTGVYLWLKKRRAKATAQGRRLRPASVSHG